MLLVYTGSTGQSTGSRTTSERPVPLYVWCVLYVCYVFSEYVLCVVCLTDASVVCCTQGLQGSQLALERRLNDLYRSMDENVDNMRTDVRLMIERVCDNNFLSC